MQNLITSWRSARAAGPSRHVEQKLQRPTADLKTGISIIKYTSILCREPRQAW